MSTSKWNPDGSQFYATTLAIGEEDGGSDYYLIKPKPVPIDPPLTTLAIGEEDSYYPEPLPIQDPTDPPVYSTMALGEEGGDPWVDVV